MKAILSAISVLALALVFGLSEPAPASHEPVKSDDVELLSEELSSEAGRYGWGKNGQSGKNGRGGGSGGPGRKGGAVRSG